ncbi:MAG TPA: hypothetical protein VM580_10625 [Labilithrix sp.]|nr:hypothetical protein [Labilithrix sp.]
MALRLLQDDVGRGKCETELSSAREECPEVDTVEREVRVESSGVEDYGAVREGRFVAHRTSISDACGSCNAPK